MDAAVKATEEAIRNLAQQAEAIPQPGTDRTYSEAEVHLILDALLNAQNIINREIGRIRDAFRVETNVQRYRLVEEHAACGHETLSNVVYERSTTEPVDDDEPLPIHRYPGRAFCSDCWSNRENDSGPELPSAEQMTAIRLYRQFSEDCYAAGWMSDPPVRREKFIRYLVNSPTGVNEDSPDGYELEDIDMLVEAVREAQAQAASEQ